MKLKQKILLIALVPLLVLEMLIVFISVKRVSSVMTSTIENGLRSAAVSVRDSYAEINDDPYFINDANELCKGDYNITKDSSTADDLRENSETDITVFYGDTRYMTSVLGEFGNRVLYTSASDTVVDKVLKQGKEYFATDVVIVNQPYYGYYIPLPDPETGEPVGMVFAGMPQASAKAQINSIITLMSGVGLAILIVCTVIVYLIVKGMVKQISASVSTLSQLAEGKLNVSVDEKVLKSKDEIGDIGRATETIRDNLHRIIASIKNDSSTLLNASAALTERTDITSDHVQQMERAADEVAQGAGNQAEETQDASDNIIMMGNIIEDTVDQLEHLRSSAKDMETRGETALAALKKLQATNQKTSEAMNIIYEQTNATNESTQKIKEATALITNIAEETNLLSLNASIEAARAGEQGRGFAVVAGQIQKLAEQSNASAKQIEDIISLLLEDSEKAVETMDDVRAVIEQQSENVTDTGTQLNSLLSDVKQSYNAILEVAEKANQLNEARNSVVNTVQSLAAIAQENAASSQETSASASEISNIVGEIATDTEELKQISNRLDDSISIFEM